MKHIKLQSDFNFASNIFLQSKLVFFAGGETASAEPDAAETQAFNLVLSEKAKKKMASSGAVIVKVQKDENQYRTGGGVVVDLVTQLKGLGFTVPEGMQFSSIDEVVDYVLAHTDFSLQPFTFGDIHIDQDAAQEFRDLKIDFIFDEATQKIDFKIPSTVQFYDLDGNKTKILPSTDATHFVDISISYDLDEDTFLLIIGMDDNTQFRKTLKYKKTQ